jgi:predicted dehydrogenase
MRTAAWLRFIVAVLACVTQACRRAAETPAARPDGEARLVIVDPGHFHASLVQKDMYPEVSPRVSVYAPLGPELLDYLNRVYVFNTRPANPTRWELDVHAAPDFFEQMPGARPGNVAVFAGRNREKIGRIVRSLEAGYHVLADKPWIIRAADFPKLAAALDLAGRKGLVAYDIMTERYEITSILQKELVNAPEVFGQLLSGSAAEPAVTARSVHHLMKVVAGVPLRRPAWFFNIEESGEGLADVGTHVVDLIEWTAFPSVTVDYRSDVQMLDAKRWPLTLSRTQFSQVTGEADFAAHLAPWVKGGQFDYYCNTAVRYAVRGVHARLEILWNWEAPPGGGDVYEAAFRGTLARAEIRQGKAENYRPELYVRPNTAALRPAVFAALGRKLAALQAQWPGVEMAVAGIVIPEKYRVGHEAHFAQVTRAFLDHLTGRRALSAWETSNMLVKYYICTQGVELSRKKQ